MEQLQSNSSNNKTNSLGFLLAIIGFITGLLLVWGAPQLASLVETLVAPIEAASISTNQWILLLIMGAPFVIIIIYIFVRLLAMNKKPTGPFMNGFFIGTILSYLVYLGLVTFYDPWYLWYLK